MAQLDLHISFVTEVDLDEIGGAVTTDRRMIRCLEQLGSVNVKYIEKTKFKSMAVALIVFTFKILRSLHKKHVVYFSRGLISTTILMLLKPVAHSQVIHQALSVPFPSNEVYYVPHSSFETAVRYPIFRFLEKNLLPRVDGITVASAEYAQVLIKAGIKNDRVHIIPFSVEAAFFNQPMKDTKGSFTFCYAGRFHLYHVLTPLVVAFGSFAQNRTNSELILVGDGPLRPEVEKAVHQKNLSGRVKFVGMISHSELPSFLSKVDCYVLLSRAPGLPIGILEAAAAGKPIITLKPEKDETLSNYFMHGKEIFMVENSSPERIAQALELLYTDSKLRQALAYGARKIAEQYFSEEAAKEKLEDLIKQIALKLQ